MAKYNVGDVLEITEDFELECASYSEGEKYSVIELDRSHYTLETDEYGYVNTVSKVDAHWGFRKVEPKAEAQGWEETLDKMERRIQQASQPEMVSVDALREALDFLGIQEVFDTENIISLAKRLS